jgi:catechol 2,3-dioxygenase-like lactoylglutathione lyase family enzyme
MITGFNHTSFTVADLDAAVAFWGALGFAPGSVGTRSGDWQARVTGVPGASLRVAHLFGHGHHMEFIQYLEGAGEARRLQPSMAGVGHVCLEVADIAAAWDELLALGASPQGEISDVSIGPAMDCRAGYVRDPNGIIIELLELKP